MTTKTVYQYDLAGIYLGETLADESPLEPGVWLIPAHCTEIAPPEITETQWPRWNGSSWGMVTRRSASSDSDVSDPVEKLRSFLSANPDVASLLNSTNETTNV